MKRTANAATATIQAVDAGQDESQRLLVTGTLSFDTVPGLMKEALRLLAAADSVVVDFSGVDSCNSAGLAVILEMARVMRQRNKTICFEALPQQIHTFARAYSVEKELSEAGFLC